MPAAAALQIASTEARDGSAPYLRQQALLEAAAVPRAVLSNPSFSIIATDERGIIQLFSVGAEGMLGYAASEVVDRISPSDIHDPAEVLARAEGLSRELGVRIAPGFEALAYKASREIGDTYELTCIRKDGSRFPAIVSITALRDEASEIIGYLLIGTDNSVGMRFESKMHAAMRAGDTANQAKAEFVSNRYLLERIDDAINATLPAPGKLAPAIAPVSLAELLAECHAMVEWQARDRNIALRFPANFYRPCYLGADRTGVKQVLVDLLFAAIGYSRRHGKVTVDFVQTAAHAVRISVRATVLWPEQLARLFQPCVGGETEEREVTSLFATKQLVDGMGGRIGADSTVATGSVLWVELGLASARQLVSPGGEENALSPAGAPAAALRTVLYVEDEEANLEAVEQLVARRSDLRLLTAAEGRLGLEYARTCLPAVILMDCDLRGMTGAEAIRILRADAATAHIPVIALGSSAAPRDIQKALCAGFFNYVGKPIVATQFMDVLDVALASSRARPPENISPDLGPKLPATEFSWPAASR